MSPTLVEDTVHVTPSVLAKVLSLSSAVATNNELGTIFNHKSPLFPTPSIGSYPEYVICLVDALAIVVPETTSTSPVKDAPDRFAFSANLSLSPFLFSTIES